MRNPALVPKPWWQVGLTALPGLIFLLDQVSSPSSSFDEALRFLLLAAVALLSLSSILRAVVRRSPFQAAVWGFVPLGLLAGLGLIALPNNLDLTNFLLLVAGLLFARRNGLSAGLFVLSGGMVVTSYYVEPVMYFWDSPFWASVVNEGATVLWTILAPVLVLRSRTILGQAASLLLPVAAYYAALVFALGKVRGFSASRSAAIAHPLAALFVTMAIAAILYAWVSSAARDPRYDTA